MADDTDAVQEEAAEGQGQGQDDAKRLTFWLDPLAMADIDNPKRCPQCGCLVTNEAWCNREVARMGASTHEVRRANGRVAIFQR